AQQPARAVVLRQPMKPTLQLKLSQHLTLTPQLQQSIRLLQVSTLELNQEVERLLQENPLLEKAEEEESGGAAPAEFAIPTVSSTTSEQPVETPEEGAGDGVDLLSGTAADSDWG